MPVPYNARHASRPSLPASTSKGLLHPTLPTKNNSPNRERTMANWDKRNLPEETESRPKITRCFWPFSFPHSRVCGKAGLLFRGTPSFSQGALVYFKKDTKRNLNMRSASFCAQEVSDSHPSIVFLFNDIGHLFYIQIINLHQFNLYWTEGSNVQNSREFDFGLYKKNFCVI